MPVWKFDGGQVLRQVFPSRLTLAVVSFVALLAFLALGCLAGLSTQLLIAIGTVFAVLSLITTGSGVKPRHELKPLVGFERAALAAAFAACFGVHFYGVMWAVAKLTAYASAPSSGRPDCRGTRVRATTCWRCRRSTPASSWPPPACTG